VKKFLIKFNLIKVLKIIIIIFILMIIIFFTKEYLEYKIKMPFNYEF